MNMLFKLGCTLVLASILCSFESLRAIDSKSPVLLKLTQEIVRLEQDKQAVLDQMKHSRVNIPTLNMEKLSMEKDLITLRGKVASIQLEMK